MRVKQICTCAGVRIVHVYTHAQIKNYRRTFGFRPLVNWAFPTTPVNLNYLSENKMHTSLPTFRKARHRFLSYPFHH